jgi:hypothetical protein
MLLSESVYKAHEAGAGAVGEAFERFAKSFPADLINIRDIQCSLPHVQQRYGLVTDLDIIHPGPLTCFLSICPPACRYLVASSEDALHVAFMGTKAIRDILSDVNYVQTAVWPGIDHKVRVLSLSH